ncbi:TPA: hypothetical protein DEP96_03070 [Candidatus Uhrbacteria bacterium]|nr:hypothetical protein [Candidatus Uhrbacteria bacterium]
MLITKTDYLEYTFCRKNLWLRKHKPELFVDVEFSDFEKKIIEDGNLAEAACRLLYPEGVLVESHHGQAVIDTKKVMEEKKTIFQATFQEDVFYLRADILCFNVELGGWELWEVKATNEVKRKVPHHHVNDLAFQKIVIEACGVKVVKTGVIHLNREYRKNGKVVNCELFIESDLTGEVTAAEEQVKGEMMQMKECLTLPEEKGCACVYEGRSNHCSTFAYSNPEVPEYSVHNFNRIGMSKKKLIDWVDRGELALTDIHNPEDLNAAQKLQYESYVLGKAIIDYGAIKEALGGLVFPLQFFDYEGYSSAIPMFDGFGAYEQIPFQYSLHIMGADGEIEHREFLITEPEGDLTLPLIERMKLDLDPNGTVISWYSSYEKQRNDKLAELHPEHASFLKEINDKMFDLMTIFSDGYYVDPAFKGSASIKKVLPVLVPELNYSVMNISKGDQASERWEKLILASTSASDKEKIKRDLLDYCALDTWAMVEIYRVLKGL